METAHHNQQHDHVVQLSFRPEENVYVLTFSGHGKHLFDPPMFQAIQKALDMVENSSAAALVTTNEGKFYSNGMDIRFAAGDHAQRLAYIQQCHSLLKRMLVFSIPTVAAIRGHAVGAGCLFALAHDCRYMRSDQGMVFMNEIDLGLCLTPGNSALLACKLTPWTYQEVVLTGRRYRGNDAVQAGLVNAALPDARSTLEAALKKASEMASKAWKRRAYQGMKVLDSEVEMAPMNYGHPIRKCSVDLDGLDVDFRTISLPQRPLSHISDIEVSNTITKDAC